MTFSHCLQKRKDKLIVVSEFGRKVTFQNKSADEYQIVQVDDCVIKSGIRCDKLVTKTGTGSIFLELKGKDVEHACDQLERTAAHADMASLAEKKIGFLIICSRYPRFDSYVMKAKQRIAKKYGAGLHIHCDKANVEFESILKF